MLETTAGLFPFAHTDHDRRGDLRGDAAEQARAWSDPASRVLVVGGEHVATLDDGLRLLAPADAPEGDDLYLGTHEGTTYLARLVERVPDELGPRSLREVAGGLAPLDGGLVVHAVGIGQWHRTHGFCSRCGTPTTVTLGGHQRECPRCGAHHFPRTDPAVIMLVGDDDGRALLGRNPAWPPGRYSTLAGFVEPGEPLEAAVRREVLEEAGVVVGEVTYAGSQPWPFPSSLMLGYHARATSHDVHVDGVEIEHALWFTREEVTAMTASGELALPPRLSISRWLVEQWHGGQVSGEWSSPR